MCLVLDQNKNINKGAGIGSKMMILGSSSLDAASGSKTPVPAPKDASMGRKMLETCSCDGSFSPKPNILLTASRDLLTFLSYISDNSKTFFFYVISVAN